MQFLPHLISLMISLCNYVEVVMASHDNIDMKPMSKSKTMHKFDHLAASALGLVKEHRGKIIKKHLEEVVKDDKVMDHLLSRRLKAKKPKDKEGKSDKESSALPNRLRQHSEPTKAAKADPNKSDKALLSCEEMLTASEVKNELSEYLLQSFEYLWSLPSWFFVQMSDNCMIDNSTGTPVIKALKEDFLNVTEAFTDRPIRYEYTNSTADFFSSFNDTFDFGGENGTEWPNSAITLVNEDKSYGVVVSAFVGSYFDASDTHYGYVLKQFPEQAAVLSLEEILDGEDSVTFDHCSIFIDSFWSVVGAIALGITCGIVGYGVGGLVGGVVGGAAGPVGALIGAVIGGTAAGVAAGIECGEAING